MKFNSILLGLCLVVLFGCSLPFDEADVYEGEEPETTQAEPASFQEEGLAQSEGEQQPSDERRAIAEQKEKLLVAAHLQNARNFMSQGEYQKALAEVNNVLVLSPSNQEAQLLFVQITSALGQENLDTQNLPADTPERFELRVQGLKAEALESLERARVLLAQGDYAKAIQELHIVMAHAKWSPLRGDWTQIMREAETLLAQAENGLAAQQESAAQTLQSGAMDLVTQEEKREQMRKQEQLRNILAQAIEAYDNERYEECVTLCDAALRIEPRSSAATEIREAAFKSARSQVGREYVKEREEHFGRLKEELAESKIPYTQLLTLPSQEEWQETTQLRAARSSKITQDAGESDENKRLKEAIETTKLPALKIQNETELDAVIGAIQSYSGLPFIVDPAAIAVAHDSSVVFNLPIEHEITIQDALNIIMEMTGDQITYVFRHDAILITTNEKAHGKLSVQNHDIQDLVFSLTDFIGPNLSKLAESTSVGGGFGSDEAPPFGSVGSEPQQIVNPDELVTLIKESIESTSWDLEGRSIQPYNGNLIVVQTPEIHEKISTFLNDLRRFSSSIVTIETKFLTVSDNYLEELGVEWRGLGGSGLGTLANLDDVTNGLEDNASGGFDNGGTGSAAENPSAGAFLDETKNNVRARTEGLFDTPLGNALSNSGGATFQVSILDDLQLNLLVRAIQKSADVQIVNSNTVSVHNAQRSYVTVINETSYIADFDVEVATSSFIANPVVGIIPDGITLDVRPIIHQNRKYITLELQPTVATLKRPIAQIQTNLAGISNAVTIQLPELQISSAFTTAVVPDGGSILIGGLKKIRNIERKAEVPWLARLPLLGVLFRTEGVSEENETLMVLIRAYITDVKDVTDKLVSGR